jgi:hypothetical protein
VSKKEDDVPAFPQADSIYPSGQVQYGSPGMTLRQYAAIKLKVPDSGTDWLDEMIRTSRRDDAAEKALAALIHSAPSGTTFGTSHDVTNLVFANASYALANAMLDAHKNR